MPNTAGVLGNGPLNRISRHESRKPGICRPGPESTPKPPQASQAENESQNEGTTARRKQIGSEVCPGGFLADFDGGARNGTSMFAQRENHTNSGRKSSKRKDSISVACTGGPVQLPPIRPEKPPMNT